MSLNTQKRNIILDHSRRIFSFVSDTFDFHPLKTLIKFQNGRFFSRSLTKTHVFNNDCVTNTVPSSEKIHFLWHTETWFSKPLTKVKMDSPRGYFISTRKKRSSFTKNKLRNIYFEARATFCEQLRNFTSLTTIYISKYRSHQSNFVSHSSRVRCNNSITQLRSG